MPNRKMHIHGTRATRRIIRALAVRLIGYLLYKQNVPRWIPRLRRWEGLSDPWN